MLKVSFVSKNSQVLIKPLFSDLDRRRRISLSEVSQVTGFPQSQLRVYAMDGTIPGGRQAAKGKRWTFDRDLLEAWWQQFNAPKPILK